jgi:hypothetical protein
MRRIGARSAGAGLIVLMLVAGCADRNREPKLLNLASSTRGPDEFSILPTKPLQAPPDFTSLPPPTPGARNLVDPTPDEDAVAALGGNPAALSRGGIPGTDGAMVTYASRYGVQSNIRQDLAAADLQYRRDNDGRLLERLFNVNVYFKAYKKQELDQYRELERFRRAGVRTPAAPPTPTR